MRKQILFLIVIVSSTIYAFAGNDNISPNDNRNNLNIEIDSLALKIVELNDRLNMLEQRTIYQKALVQLVLILNDAKILKNSIDIFDNTLLVFEVHDYLKKKTKKALMPTIDNFQKSAELNIEELKNWKIIFDFQISLNSFTEEETELLSNRYEAALIAMNLVSSSINSVYSKLD